MIPILYSFRRCPYAMRARLAIAASAVRCELREIVLRDKPAAMLQASPKGTVPVLVIGDGKVIDQSLEIMLWALQQHDPEGWLKPDLAAMVALVEECDTHFKPHLDRYKYPQRYENAQAPEIHRQRAVDWLMVLEGRLGMSDGLFGSHPALADMAIAPFVRQFVSVDADWFEAQPMPGVQRWLSRFLSSPLFEQVMQKYPVWKDGEAGVLFPG